MLQKSIPLKTMPSLYFHSLPRHHRIAAFVSNEYAHLSLHVIARCCRSATPSRTSMQISEWDIIHALPSGSDIHT